MLLLEARVLLREARMLLRKARLLPRELLGQSPVRSQEAVNPALLNYQDTALREDQVSGPLSIFNSTRARFDFRSRQSEDASGSEGRDCSQKAWLEWRARDGCALRKVCTIVDNWCAISGYLRCVLALVASHGGGGIQARKSDN